MIIGLDGSLKLKSPTSVHLEVHGVVYEVFIPVTTFDRLPNEADRAFLYIHHYFREDMQSLYGFITKDERDLFQILISVSGIGPKVGMTVLSALTFNEVVMAIKEGDGSRLCSIPGIGKKTAERMILDLADKVIKRFASPASKDERIELSQRTYVEDAISALEALGFKRKDAKKKVESVEKLFPDSKSAEVLIKAALKRS